MEPTGGHIHAHDETKVVPTDRGRFEVSIFEDGVPPRFRIHFFDKEGKPIAPGTHNVVNIETIRAAGARQTFAFEDRDAQYLEAVDELPEPHEFAAVVSMTDDDHAHTFNLQFREHPHGHGPGGEHVHEHDYGARGGDHAHEHAGGLKGLLLRALHLDHSQAEGEHSHVSVDGSLLSNERGIWALKVSFLALGATAIFQAGVFAMSGSTGLLADTIHNFADAGTAIPLWVAFTLQRRASSARFTYGLNRTEDLAGVVIVGVIFASSVVAGYESIQRLITQEMPTHIPLAMVAAFVGFLGNELVAQFRLRVGREIGSAALIADGLHARTDGFTSLAALAGLAGALAGYPIFDGIAGLLITVMIMMIVIRDAAPSVFTRLLDGIEPATVEKLRSAAAGVEGVEEVNWVRARWGGHMVDCEVSVRLAGSMSLEDSHRIAHEVEHVMGHAIEHPGNVLVKTSTHHEDVPAGYVHSHEHPASS